MSKRDGILKNEAAVSLSLSRAPVCQSVDARETQHALFQDGNAAVCKKLGHVPSKAELEMGVPMQGTERQSPPRRNLQRNERSRTSQGENLSK